MWVRMLWCLCGLWPNECAGNQAYASTCEPRQQCGMIRCHNHSANWYLFGSFLWNQFFIEYNRTERNISSVVRNGLRIHWIDSICYQIRYWLTIVPRIHAFVVSLREETEEERSGRERDECDICQYIDGESDLKSERLLNLIDIYSPLRADRLISCG